jgi:transcriptional regulator with XRE-family HTH domain
MYQHLYMSTPKFHLDLDGLANRLLSVRQSMGLSQLEWATKAGVSRMTQFRYEKEGEGGQLPPLEYFSKIASELGVDWLYLMAGDQSTPNLRGMGNGPS